MVIKFHTWVTKLWVWCAVLFNSNEMNYVIDLNHLWEINVFSVGFYKTLDPKFFALVMILIMCMFVFFVFGYTQGAWYSSLGSFTLPAPAAGHQRETRSVNSAHRRPHPHRQPETRARKLSFPEGGILPGRQSLLYGPGYANHTLQRYNLYQRLNLFIENISILSDWMCCRSWCEHYLLRKRWKWKTDKSAHTHTRIRKVKHVIETSGTTFQHQSQPRMT